MFEIVINGLSTIVKTIIFFIAFPLLMILSAIYIYSVYFFVKTLYKIINEIRTNEVIIRVYDIFIKADY